MKKLDSHKQHCVWRRDEVGGRVTKVPYRSSSVVNRTPYRLSSAKPEHFSVKSVADLAVGAFPEFAHGVMLGPVGDTGQVLVGIDIDGTNDPEVDALAMELVAEWDTYTEVSPSGDGLKIFALMDADDMDLLEMSQEWTSTASRGGHVEITFHRGHRFFAVTGDSLFGYEELNEVGVVVVNRLLTVVQPAFKVDAAQRVGGDTSGAGGFGDRSSMVVGFIADQLKGGLADEEDVYEGILELESGSEGVDLVQSWVSEQQANGSVGERQLSRAYNRVRDNLEEYGIYDAEENPAFEMLEGETSEFSSGKPAVAPEGDAYTELEVDEESGLVIPPLVSRINKSYGYCTLKGGVRFLHWDDDGNMDPMSFHDFKLSVATYGKQMTEYGPVEPGVYWKDNPFRREFKGITFSPANPGRPITVKGEKYYNTCPPLRVVPMDGDVTGFTKVIEESVCSTQEEAEWLKNYLAHVIQKPEDRPSIHPILFGDMGIGKDVVINVMRNVLYRDAVVDFDFGSTSNFNSRLKTGLIINVPEARDLSYASVESKMKNYMTMKHVEINEKFVPDYSVPFYGRFIFTTNEVNAMPVGPGDRRYVPIKGRDKFSSMSQELTNEERRAFFDDVYDKFINGKEAGVVLKYLMDRDISKFNPNVMPDFVYADGSLKALMAEGNMSVESEVVVEMIRVEGDIDDDDDDITQRFLKTTPRGVVFVIPSEVVELAKSLDGCRSTFKQKRFTDRQWALALIQFLRAERIVVKVEGKSKKVWEVDRRTLEFISEKAKGK